MADIRNTAVGRAFHDAFDHLTTGNRSETTVKTLDLNGTLLTYDVHMRSHDVRKIGIGGFSREITVFDFSFDSHGTVDVKSPNPQQVHIRIDLPAGQHVDFDLGHLIELAAALA